MGSNLGPPGVQILGVQILGPDPGGPDLGVRPSNKTFARARDRVIYAIYTPFWDPPKGREREYDPWKRCKIGYFDPFRHIWGIQCSGVKIPVHPSKDSRSRYTEYQDIGRSRIHSLPGLFQSRVGEAIQASRPKCIGSGYQVQHPRPQTPDPRSSN